MARIHKLTLTEQTWVFGGFTASYDYVSEIWNVKHIGLYHSLEGLSFGKPSAKAAKHAIKYGISNLF